MFYEKSIFFLTKDSIILLFLVKYYAVKTNIIMYYLLLNFAALERTKNIDVDMLQTNNLRNLHKRKRKKYTVSSINTYTPTKPLYWRSSSIAAKRGHLERLIYESLKCSTTIAFVTFYDAAESIVCPQLLYVVAWTFVLFQLSCSRAVTDGSGMQLEG